METTETVYRIANSTAIGPDCTMFVLCSNDATLLIPHPVLDFAFSCERCARRLGYDVHDNLPVADVTVTP